MIREDEQSALRLDLSVSDLFWAESKLKSFTMLKSSKVKQVYAQLILLCNNFKGLQEHNLIRLNLLSFLE